jgi:hypothetical protein
MGTDDNGDEKLGPSPLPLKPQQPPPIVSPFLERLEQEILQHQGLNPQDYAAIIATADAMQFQIVRDPRDNRMKTVLILQLQVDFDDVLPLKVSTIVDPHTKQPHVTTGGLPMPMDPRPLCRVFVRRDALGPLAKDDIRRTLTAHFGGAIGGGVRGLAANTPIVALNADTEEPKT